MYKSDPGHLRWPQLYGLPPVAYQMGTASCRLKKSSQTQRDPKRKPDILRYDAGRMITTHTVPSLFTKLSGISERAWTILVKLRHSRLLT